MCSLQLTTTGQASLEQEYKTWSLFSGQITFGVRFLPPPDLYGTMRQMARNDLSDTIIDRDDQYNAFF